MKVSAIIAAAGHGQRMRAAISKQFLNLKGKPIIVHTLDVFYRIKRINEIILVVGSNEMEYCNSEIIKRHLFKGIKLVPGGKERQDSVYNGLRACNPQTDFVIIHDGVRPLINQDIVIKALSTAEIYGACGVAVPVKDTIKVVDEKGFVKNTPDRDRLWAVQTPQVFRYPLILKAHERAREQGFIGTDDTVLVERLGERVKIIEGSYENIKITTPEDLTIAESILSR
ncbi:MAG: 2-C-methyl-D-erythritol 4-phosphate cytidylyltransferase [Firmicutes bacterium]|nr:2-C-methyl-D-erythritol 4-phosphate cytidylyltransferase [Bacillota bacterium]